MEGIQLPATLALLLTPDLIGARQQHGKRRLDILMAGCNAEARVRGFELGDG